MTNGTHAARGRKIKPIALIISIILVAGLAIAGTTAWLTNKTNSVTNSFTPGKVTTEITEDLKDNTKSNIKVKNTGNVDAYVRASVVMNWVDASGNVVASADGLPALPAVPTSLGTNWVHGSDGYYYYTGRVTAGSTTLNAIFTSGISEPANVPTGYHLQVTILAEGIQADGVDSSNTPAVEVAWGNVVSVNANGTLTVAEA